MGNQPTQSGSPQPPKTPPWATTGVLDAVLLKKEVTTAMEKLKNESPAAQLVGAEELLNIVTVMWLLDTTLARDAADVVCEKLRVDGALDRIMFLATSSTKASNKRLQLAVLKVLEQVMISENREYIARHKRFSILLELARSTDNLEAIRCGTGILENLFKVSSEVSLQLIRSEGLESVLHGCRLSDKEVLVHCAAALANCALFGGEEVHRAMVARHADHWLFPLGFSDDSVLKYYALIAICILASDPELAECVQQSGTLEMVLPFLTVQDPLLFPRSSPTHAHGRTSSWLERMIPLLVCNCEEARSLAAFHFAMEAGIKKRQKRLQVFNEIQVVEPLQAAARDGSRLTSRFASQALELMQQPLPPYQCWNVCDWTPKQVEQWVADLGLEDIAPRFSTNRVNGQLLVDITQQELQHPDAIDCSSPLVCKWFLQQVRRLRCKSDFSVEDPDKICQWLTTIGPELAVYKPDFIRNHVTKELLPHLTEDVMADIGVSSVVDRLKLSMAVERLAHQDTPDFEAHLRSIAPTSRKKYDVFLSYRRSNGSQLASLLKVHLQLRGMNVFLDVTGLGSGKFDEALLTTISNSLNMIMVLTPGALNRCMGDTQTDDWVHKELVHALENSIQVIPVLDKFDWPDTNDLPSDIASLPKMNGVSWSHEYQDACVDKIMSFLHLPFAYRRRGTTSSFPKLRAIRTDSLNTLTE